MLLHPAVSSMHSHTPYLSYSIRPDFAKLPSTVAGSTRIQPGFCDLLEKFIISRSIQRLERICCLKKIMFAMWADARLNT
jgi:hypothetical protein